MTTFILNATMHNATEDQANDGLIDINGGMHEGLMDLLLFKEMPTAIEVVQRARKISMLLKIEADVLAKFQIGIGKVTQPIAVMIGGAPYLMGPLAEELKEQGLKPVFSYSERVSQEEVLPDGSVRKINSFVHKGWVDAIADPEELASFDEEAERRYEEVRAERARYDAVPSWLAYGEEEDYINGLY